MNAYGSVSRSSQLEAMLSAATAMSRVPLWYRTILFGLMILTVAMALLEGFLIGRWLA